MAYYKAVVHYHFKKGQEKQAIKFIENELLKAAKECGCHNIEFGYDEKDPCHFIGMGTWDNKEAWKKFHHQWIVKNEDKLMQFCEHHPHRDLYKIEKKKAA